MVTDEQRQKEVEKRRTIERRIVRRLVLALIKAGYSVSLYDGQEWVAKKEKTWKAVKDKFFSVDEETLYAYDAEGRRIGVVFLVYGNGGWDVMADWSSSLEPVVNPVLDYAETLCD